MRGRPTGEGKQGDMAGEWVGKRQLSLFIFAKLFIEELVSTQSQ